MILAKASAAPIIEKALIEGDLSCLSAEERLNHYRSVCESIGLNPLSKPLEYVKLNGKMVLYASKGCTDQIRSLRGITLSKPDIQVQDGLIVVSITARDRAGREDSDVGVVSLGNAQGETKANAIMKAVSKAKRRVTLSICSLGFLDAPMNEIEDVIPVEIAESVPQRNAEPQEDHPEQNDRIAAVRQITGHSKADIKQWLANWGAKAPQYLSTERCNNLVIALCVDWAQKNKINVDEAQASFNQHIPNLTKSGMNEAEAIAAWMQHILPPTDLDEEPPI